MSLYPDPLHVVSWNPMEGCTRISEGCKNCWALNMRWRFGGGEVLGQPPVTEPVLRPDRLEVPLRRRKPTVYAVAFMGDLFHDEVPDEFIDKVFAVMALTPQHTYLLLTKRPERMREYIVWRDDHWPRFDGSTEIRTRHDEVVEAIANMGLEFDEDLPPDAFDDWPLPNVWLGASAENQHFADERIPLLLDTPAAHRWVSLEPMLGAIELRVGEWLPPAGGGPKCNVLRPWAMPPPSPDWVVLGGESGPRARPCRIEWIADAVNQCQAAGVKVFVKQDSGRHPSQQGSIPDNLWMIKQIPEEWHL